MEELLIRKIVENYKKMQLYSIDSNPVKTSILWDLEQDLADAEQYVVDKNMVIAKLIAFLEFGFSWEPYHELFERVLEFCQMNREDLERFQKIEAQNIRLSRKNLREILIWKTREKKNYKNKGDVIQEILNIVKQREIGNYIFETELCAYQLEVRKDTVVFQNLKKEIFYNILE